MRSKKMEKWISTEFWNHNAKEDFFMAKEYFMDEVAVLKKIVQEAGGCGSIRKMKCLI